MKKFLIVFTVVLSFQVVYSQNSNDNNETTKLTQLAKSYVHLVTEVSKVEAKVDDKLYVEYKLYVSFNANINDYSIAKVPENSDFTIENIKMKGLSIKTGKYKGEPYRYVVIKKLYLTPKSTGTLKLDPILVNLSVGVPSKSEDFFENPIIKNVTIQLKSQEKTVNIKD